MVSCDGAARCSTAQRSQKTSHAIQEALARQHRITRQGAQPLPLYDPGPARSNICMRHLNAARTVDLCAFTTH